MKSSGLFLENAPKEIHFELYNITTHIRWDMNHAPSLITSVPVARAVGVFQVEKTPFLVAQSS
jgi:hypothetical protein